PPPCTAHSHGPLIFPTINKRSEGNAMAWQRNRYYVRSVRCGKKVTTEYLGASLLAQEIALADAEARARRADRRRQRLHLHSLDGFAENLCAGWAGVVGAPSPPQAYPHPPGGKGRKNRIPPHPALRYKTGMKKPRRRAAAGAPAAGRIVDCLFGDRARLEYH